MMIKKLMMEKADRIYHLPPVIDEFLPRKDRKKMLGQEILDLARFQWPIGSGGEPVPAGLEAADERDIEALKNKTAEWYKERFGGRIKASREIFIGGSVRRIINLIALAFYNPGDVILVPDPGIWHYRAAAVLAAAETVPYHLSERNRYKPTADAVSTTLGRLVKAMIVNSPHNPTGAVLGKDELNELLRLAGRDNILLILDHVFEGLVERDQPSSFYSLPGGRKVALELYSYAYNFGHPLPSIGFAIGQPTLISGLKRVAATFGQTLRGGEVKAALAALENSGDAVIEMRKLFSRHRELLDQLCRKIRLYPAEFGNGPFYWAKLPGRKQSARFARSLYLQCGILTVPGHAFGEGGEGFLRFSLTADTATYENAIKASGRLLQMAKERKQSSG